MQSQAGQHAGKGRDRGRDSCQVLSPPGLSGLLLGLLWLIGSWVTYGRLSMFTSPALIPQHGQVRLTDGRPASFIHYYATLPGVHVAITDWGLSLVFYRPHDKDSLRFHAQRVDIHFVIAGQDSVLQGLQPEYVGQLPFHFNFYYPHCRLTHLPGVDSVVYRLGQDVGLHIRYDGKHAQYPLKIDWSLARAGILKAMTYRVVGASRVFVDHAGRLCIASEWGAQWCEEAPILLAGNQRYRGEWVVTPSSGAYRWEVRIGVPDAVLASDDSVYVDPPVVWSTYVGGSSADEPWGIHSSERFVWATFVTVSMDFPTQPFGGGYYDNTINGNRDMVVGLFEKPDFALRWMTYYGGSAEDFPHDVYAWGAYGWVTGRTFSSDFPLQNAGGYWDNTLNGSRDAFFVQFDTNGVLIWATYFGGDGDEAISWGEGSSVDGWKDTVVFVLETTSSTGLTVTGPAGSFQQATYSGGQDIFIVEIDAATHTILWSTYLGAPTMEKYPQVSVDHRFIWFLVWAYGSGLPLVALPGALNQNYQNGRDGYLARFTRSGQMTWASYFGSAGNEAWNGIHSDGKHVYLTGTATGTSTNFNALFPWWQNSCAGGCVDYDGIFAMLDAGARPQWGFFYGSSKQENFHYGSGFWCGLVAGGHGSAVSPYTPVVADTQYFPGGYIQSAPGGNGYNAYLIWIAPNSQVLWGTYYRASVPATNDVMRVHADTDFFYYGGFANPNSLPVTVAPLGGYLQSSSGGATDGWLSAFPVPFRPLQVDTVWVDTPSGCTDPWVVHVSYSGGFPNATFIYWSTGVVSTDTVDSLVVMPADTEQIVYFMIVDTMCLDTFFSDTLRILPGIPIDSLVVHPRCYGDSSGAIMLDIPLDQYTIVWNTGDTVDTLTGLGPGTYIAYIEDDQGCQDTLYFQLEWQSMLQATGNSTFLQCDPPQYQLSVQYSGGAGSVSITWSHGVTDSMQVVVPPGAYVALVEDSLGCWDTVVYFVPPPSAHTLTLSPDTDTVLWGEGLWITVDGAWDQWVNWFWWVSSPPYPSSSPFPSFYYVPDTTTLLVLTVEDQLGCVYRDSVWIVVEYKEALWIPDAFTPNGDGVNDLFRLHGFGIRQITWRIYNRWGELVFEGHSLSDAWDGTYRGQPQEMDAYVLVVDVLFATWRRERIRKNILLIR